MADQYAQSFGVLNYSGLIFNTSDTKTPLLNMLPRKKTTSVKFVIETRYALGEASQPSISETASLTAPEAKVVTRDQEYNVTQIFQKATAVSYAKLSNTGTMSGVNIGGQNNNVMNELDFQVSAKTQEMRNDIEYTIINGRYAEATNDTTANKTRGFIEAIVTNVIPLGGELTNEVIGDAMQKLYETNAPTDGIVMVVPPVIKRVVSSIYPKELGFILPASRNVGGVAIDEILTDFGTVGIMVHNRVPTDTILFLNLGVAGVVEQDVPEKGNFFWEELARTGAGIKGEIFGQLGLDYGPEWYHAKITGVSTGATPPATVSAKMR